MTLDAPATHTPVSGHSGHKDVGCVQDSRLRTRSVLVDTFSKCCESLFACEMQQGFNRETQVTRSVVCKCFTWKNQSRNPSGPGERRWRVVPRRSGSVQVAGGWEMGLWGFSAVVGGPTEPDLTKPTDFPAQEMMV